MFSNFYISTDIFYPALTLHPSAAALAPLFKCRQRSRRPHFGALSTVVLEPNCNHS